MSNKNDVTGDKLISKYGDKEAQKNFDKGWDILFKKDKPIEPEYIPHWVLGCEECLQQQKEEEHAS